MYKNASGIKVALSKLDQLLEKEFHSRNLAGMSVGIVYDQELLWAKGYGYRHLEKKKIADGKTIYNCGSVTKIFTAAMLMRLRDDEKLNLDDPIEKYLPGFKIRSRFPDARPPTFRQVVAHLAGVPREPSSRRLEGWPPLDSILTDLKKVEIIGPTYSFKYSNLGYAVMGHALARIAGEPYKQYVTKKIFEPLGMRNTGWDLTEEMNAHLAVGYEPLNRDNMRKAAKIYDSSGTAAPCGGVHMSVEDISRFISLQFREGPAGGSQILGSTTIREMQNPVVVWDDWSGGYGIGWQLNTTGRILGYGTVGHGGGTPGYVAACEFVPKLKLGIVVLVNQITDQNSLSRVMLETLIPVFSDILARQESQVVRALPPEVEKWAGRYISTEGTPFDMVIEDCHILLYWFVDGKRISPFEFIPEEDQTYRIKGGPLDGELAHFELNSEGDLKRVKAGGYTLQRSK